MKRGKQIRLPRFLRRRIWIAVCGFLAVCVMYGQTNVFAAEEDQASYVYGYGAGAWGDGGEPYVLVEEAEAAADNWEEYIPVWDEEVKRERCIHRQSNSIGGMAYEDVFQFDFPNSFYSGTTNLDTQISAFFPDSSDTEIVFNVAPNKRGRNAFSANQREFRKNIAMRMEEVLGETADHLSFEWYYLDNGDAVYFYSFEMEDAQGEKWVEAVGYRLCENLTAEFIGISPLRECRPVSDMVRYMAADFKDLSTKEDAQDFSLWGGGSGSYMGADAWDYEEFHNAFAVGYRKITGKKWKSKTELESMVHIPEEEDYKVEFHSPIVESALWHYLDKMGEPLYASDLESIDTFGLVEWYPADSVSINGETVWFPFEEMYEAYKEEMPEHYLEDALLDLRNFPNLSKLIISSDDVDSFEKTGGLTGLKDLTLSPGLYSEQQVHDISFLGRLENLEMLTVKDAFDNIKDWSVLENCPKLENVRITTQQSVQGLEFPERIHVTKVY